MEEILASIRRIISEDGDAKPADAAAPDAAEPPPAPKPPEPAQAAPPPSPEPAPAPPPPAPPPPAPPPPIAAAAPDDDVLELTEVAPEEPVEEEPPPPPAPRPVPMPSVEELLSPASAGAAAAAFATLNNGGDRPMSPPLALGDGSRTIEDIVRELLRPMLKSWLDENLPGMVERMVRAEIERVARRN